MESFDKQSEQKKGINKVFIIALVFAVLSATAIIYLTTLMPAAEQTRTETLENAYREGSPEFEALTKKIIISNNADKMTELRTGIGTIVMRLTGTVKNITGKTITGLEIKVGMINSKNEVIKDKTLVIIPKEIEKLESGKETQVTVSIDGFSEDDDRANAFWKVSAIKTAE